MVLGVYLGMIALLFALQTRLIFPGAETQGQPSAVVRPGPGSELLTLETARGERVAALFGPALTAAGRPLPDAAARPTILYFYGNAMCLRDAAFELERMRRLGVNVLIPEYLGYGMSGGKPGEAGCYTTADAAYAHLATRPDIDPHLIVAAGWSLGGAVAVDLAARRPVAGLILFSTFTSGIDMSRRLFPFLPASLLLRHRFESRKKIARVTCPILIGHGRRDRIVPFAMAESLAASARSPVMRLTIDEADHNDFYAIGGAAIDQALTRFLDQLTPTR
jgi:fermentation-respiration switch protein FrsA (DUF1100 family)